MNILFLLIPLSVVLVFIIGAVFWWALENGQFEDLEGPAHRILTEDDAPLEARNVSRRAGSARRREHGQR
jgi:cbb3-type cytochrome oxidase maturation protein